MKGLGQTVSESQGLGKERLDMAELAARALSGRSVLRIAPALFEPWKDHPAAASLLELVTLPELEREEIVSALEGVLHASRSPREDERLHLPKWVLARIRLFVWRSEQFTFEHEPECWLVLETKSDVWLRFAGASDIDADDEDLASSASKALTLREHTADVRHAAREFASRCLPQFHDVISAAADAHDLGKLDWRFQVLLHNGNEDEAQTALDTGRPLAKSRRLPKRKRRRLEILPKGFRHEFLSIQLARHFGLTPDDPMARDLALHLIASHHGHARPFAPVVEDSQPGEVSLRPLGIEAALPAEQRKLSPTHRLDSGVAERFWRLTRRFGWWGLAYLETVFRLADWHASREPGFAASEEPRLWKRSQPNAVATDWPATPLDALNGSNPLAFLAALGTVRVLARVLPANDFRLGWTRRAGAWRPILETREAIDPEAILELLHQHGLKLAQMFSPKLLAATETVSPKNKKGEANWKDKLMFPLQDFRAFCELAVNEPNGMAEFTATWAGETGASDKNGIELARKTRFDFTAGQQAFIGMVRELRTACSKDDLRRALFDGWRYSNLAISMRWDPADEKRQYALQAVDPTNGSENPPLADLGANFLALEALTFFPVIADRQASQHGFSRDGRRSFWRWPIWSTTLSVDGIRSVLSLPLANSELWPEEQRVALGVAAVFQSAIVQPSGRYRCFTPPRVLQ